MLRCPDAWLQHHFSAASASASTSSCSVLSAALPRRPPARLAALAARWSGQQQRRRRRQQHPRELAQLHQLKLPRRQPEHPSRAALPRRRLWPRRLTTPGSQSLPRPARRGETNQSGRPKVFLRLCSAGLFPGEAVMLLGFGMGEAWEGRRVEDSWFRNLRCCETARPIEVGLGRLLTAGSPRLGREGRPGVTLSPEPPCGDSASWHPGAAVVGPVYKRRCWRENP